MLFFFLLYDMTREATQKKNSHPRGAGLLGTWLRAEGASGSMPIFGEQILKPRG